MAEIRNIEQRIEQLETRQKQDKALLARLKARQAQAERKLDTRRKILVGAVVLRKAQSDPAIVAQLTRWLDEGLTAPRDRALFPGLALALEKQTEESCPNNSAPKPAPPDGNSRPN